MRNNVSLHNINTWGNYVVGDTSAYDLLLRQSRKLGAAAMSTLRQLQIDTSDFLSARIAGIVPNRDSEPGKLNDIIDQSKEVLASARTVMLPNNLFTDTLTVDRHKVTIYKRTFFWSADVITIYITDILNVSTSVGPFFGSITISSRVMNSTDHYAINYFWRKDAIRLKHIIQGYVIALQNGVDTSQLSGDKLRAKLSELGHDPRT